MMIASQVLAAKPEIIGEYGDWTAYYYRDSKGIICYAASAPKLDEGKYSKRGEIVAVVTHRPNDKSFDVFNITAGYTYKTEAPVTIKIGSKTIDKIFTNADKAWAINDTVDKELIAEMKRGSRMIVHGTSSKGSNTKDSYSLSGFGSAYKAISDKCKKK